MVVKSPFRSGFRYPDMKGKSVYPGHMAKGLREATTNLKKCHCIIEVHDARIPLTGRNQSFKRLVESKPVIHVLNKSDLCDIQKTQKLMNHSTKYLLTNSNDQHHSSINKLMKTILEFPVTDDVIKIMVLGIPNVGKSSLINSLRRKFLGIGKATTVGSEPGITRRLTEFIKISERPPVFLRDTPGILFPRIDNGEVLMRLAAIGTFRDHFIGETVIADYILHMMNQQKNFRYIDVYKLDGPTIDIDEFLKLAARQLQTYLKGGLLNSSRSAKHFINNFRLGKLGKVTLD